MFFSVNQLSLKGAQEIWPRQAQSECRKQGSNEITECVGNGALVSLKQMQKSGSWCVSCTSFPRMGKETSECKGSAEWGLVSSQMKNCAMISLKKTW